MWRKTVPLLLVLSSHEIGKAAPLDQRQRNCSTVLTWRLTAPYPPNGLIFTLIEVPPPAFLPAETSNETKRNAKHNSLYREHCFSFWFFLFLRSLCNLYVVLAHPFIHSHSSQAETDSHTHIELNSIYKTRLNPTWKASMLINNNYLLNLFQVFPLKLAKKVKSGGFCKRRWLTRV